MIDDDEVPARFDRFRSNLEAGFRGEGIDGYTIRLEKCPDGQRFVVEIPLPDDDRQGQLRIIVPVKNLSPTNEFEDVDIIENLATGRWRGLPLTDRRATVTLYDPAP